MEKGELPGLSERLVWHDATHLQVGDTRFFLTIDQNAAGAAESTAEQFVLMKLDVLVNSTLEHLPDSIENMVELGIYKGGSIAMNEELYSPQKFVGIEGSAKRVQALDNFIQQRGATDRIKLYYGTDQGDRTTVESIALENFGGERCLDLVIDDCSHLYEPTKTSLNVFLPLLRYGGIYLI